MADEIYWPPFRYDTILHPATASISSELPGPDKTRLRDDLLRTPPKPPEFIVKGFLPIAPGIRVGAGGTGKTTLNQFEHLSIVLGLDLYGLKVEKPGAVLSITKEDERIDYEFRYSRIIAARRDLSDLQKRQFLANAYVMELVGTDERLVKVEDGNLLMTNLAERIIKNFHNTGVSLIEFDPMIFFGPGERFVNDGEAHLMQVGRLLCRELKCCVRFSHHISKAAFRDGTIDQYAGRGGSAGADNARFVHLLARHTENDARRGRDSGYIAPPGIPTYAIEQGSVLRLHVEKMSGAPRIQDPFWIERNHWMFRHHETPSPLAQRQALENSQKLQEQQDAAKLVAFIGTELQIGIKHSTRSLVSRCSAIGISKTRVQRAIEVAEAGRLIVLTPLPTHERRGSKSHFFDLPSATAATPEPQKSAPRARRSRSAVTKK